MTETEKAKVYKYYWPHYALAGGVFFPLMGVLQLGSKYDQPMGGIVSLGIGIICLISGVRKWGVPYITLTGEEMIVRDGWMHGKPTKIVRWEDMCFFSRRRGYELYIGMKDGHTERIPFFCMRHPAVKNLINDIISRIEENKQPAQTPIEE